MDEVLRPGDLIDSRFELLEKLGAGGMGVVFRARDVKLQYDVALKVLALRRSSSETDPAEYVQRFRSEILLARKVRHTNVCAIHEYGEDRGTPYFSMDLIDGEDLRQILRRRGRLEGDEAYDLASQVADGLQAIHAAGIVHRDLKPANIMLGRDGHVRLMDFGIAKANDTQEAITDVGHVMGTPHYMSPEQARGRRLDARSDIYAFGALLFELFTGRQVFSGRNVMYKHVESEPALDHPSLPRALEPVLRRALAKDPAQRPPSAAEMLREIRDARDFARRAGTETWNPLPAAPREPPVSPGPSVPPEASLLVPYLLHALQHGDSTVRGRALVALGMLPDLDESVKSVLRAACADSDPRVQTIASEVVSRVTGPEPPMAPSAPEPPAPPQVDASADEPTVLGHQRDAPEDAPPAPPRPEDGSIHETITDLVTPRPSEPRPPRPRPQQPVPAPHPRGGRGLGWGLWLAAGLAAVVAWTAWCRGQREEPPTAVPPVTATTLRPVSPDGAAPSPSPPPTGVTLAPSTGPTSTPAPPDVGPTPAQAPTAPPAVRVTPQPGATPAPKPTPTTARELPPAAVNAATPSPTPSPSPAPTAVPSPAPPTPTPAPTPRPVREGELVAADDPEITLARMHESEERAEYPAAARRAGRSGTVLVKALVDESGRVLEAEAFRGDAVFYDSAVTWLRKRTFDPATKRGVRVRVWMVIPVEFRLSD